MGWFGKLTLGGLGLLMGGPLGAIAGAALGHHLFDREDSVPHRSLPFRQAEESQTAYFVSLFSILGRLAKSDGFVSREEIRIVDGFINGLRISEQQKQFAKNIFNEAKNSSYSIDDFAQQLYWINQSQPTVLLSFMDLLLRVAAADGRLHSGEEAVLERVRTIFRIGEQQYDNMKSAHFKKNDADYSALDCTPQNSNEEIKSKYKKLVKEFHPDTVISKGLPEEFVDFATKRFQEIQHAYDNIRKERGF